LKQRAALDAFPDAISDEDRDRFFVLSDLDQEFVGRFGEGAVDVALMYSTSWVIWWTRDRLDLALCEL